MGEHWFAAELNRHKGQLLLRQGHAEAAVDLYRKALSIAQEQEAKLWELRAARLRQRADIGPGITEILSRLRQRADIGPGITEILAADADEKRWPKKPDLFGIRDQPIDPPPLDLVGRPRPLISIADSRVRARAPRDGGSVGAFSRRPTRSRPRSASRH